MQSMNIHENTFGITHNDQRDDSTKPRDGHVEARKIAGQVRVRLLRESPGTLPTLGWGSPPPGTLPPDNSGLQRQNPALACLPSHRLRHTHIHTVKNDHLKKKLV